MTDDVERNLGITEVGAIEEAFAEAAAYRDGPPGQPERQSQWKETVKRRGLMAGAAALIAAALVRRSSQPAAAASGGGSGGNFVNGSNYGNGPNTATEISVLTPASGTFTGAVILDVEANFGGGVGNNLNAIYGSGVGTGAGVIGECGGTANDNVATLPNAGVWGNNFNGGDGVYGSSDLGNGVHGLSTAPASVGVLGECDNGRGAVGVQGTSTTGVGVYGACGVAVPHGYGTGGIYGVAGFGGPVGTWGGGIVNGVVGVTDFVKEPTNVTAGVLGTGTHIGVVGLTTSTTAAAVEGDGVALGVQGVSVTTGTSTGYGVKGAVMNGAGSAGVLGYAPNGVGYGFYGYSTSGAAAGCLAYNTTTSGYGLQAYNGGAGTGYAALFGFSGTPHSGNVLVEGTLTTFNSAPSVAARDASGGLHRLYGVQSPDSWFEDFGSAQLNGGSSSVQLDPAFAQLIDTSRYHVFVSPDGDSQGWLYVSGKSATAFTVSAVGGSGSQDKSGAGGGGSGVSFSYRVVGKRRDVAAVRLEPVAEPPAMAPPAVPAAAVTPATQPEG